MPRRGRVAPTPSLWPPSFKATIFDFDGTISDTAHLWHEVDVAFLGAHGIDFDESYGRALNVLGFAAGARYTIERYGLSESVEEVCETWTRMGRALYETRATLRPGVEAYLHALRAQGIPLGLATTTARSVLDAIQHVDVEGLFDARVHGAEVTRGKDHPDIYLECAHRLDANPEDCIVFEDIMQGVRSAHSVGMLTCGVRSSDPIQQVEELQSISDLWLDSWEGIAPRPSAFPSARQ